MKAPEFDSKELAIGWLRENKDTLLAAKKSQIKYADAVSNYPVYIMQDEVYKANKPVNDADISELKVKVAINTTNLMDSHGDVHIPGLWKKSLKENRNIMHLQEHEMKFDHIIADGQDVKASTEVMSWKDLGQAWAGQTEALVFESTVKQDRNEFMFGQYRKALVNNHSVGMYYVKFFLAVNSDEEYWKEEKKTWDKYIDQVANKERAESRGYFYAVTEAKVVEGSAVPMGSNWVTPTLDNNLKEPPQGTHKEPVKTTLTTEEIIKRIKEF